MSLYGIPLNAEPWTVGQLGLGRRKGKVYPTITKDSNLRVFQAAVKEEMAHRYPDAPIRTGDIDLTFYLWRNLAEYQGAKKKVHRQQADATNLQKALEDALQGVLYDNDRDNRCVCTETIQQGPDVEPFCLIMIEDYLPTNSELLASYRQRAIDDWAQSPNLFTPQDRTDMPDLF